jgi:hypothetical protein
MATQNVNIGINVSDNGTAKKVVKSFQEITQAATQAQRAAQGINAPGGGTGGSRMVAARSAPTGSQRMMDNESYGSARGTAGLTGASARDFANQAQGLGGLVRLYATYAANVFAVSAAFTALSNAMDTTNMIRGLDQLGAATGRNLGGLSKRLVEITDGAISFKDSMDAVAKTTSAGMASRDVERLAMVAKNASLALGVAMPDAMNRLSRGITKLEPELLDELGIFTKIDPAVQAYSRAVGKAASQLTDFERRQAFANAVLLEGEAKFGELATAAVNPYDTLLASLKNVTQQALEVVNKVLTPMVSLLASSPGALAGALAVLGTVLLRQAIPALTEFKAGLASAADTATDLAKSKAEDAKAARARIDKDILAEVELRAAKEIDAVDAAEEKIRKLRKAGYKQDSLAAKLLAQDLDDIRNEDLAKQERVAKRLESRAKRLADDPTTDPQALRNAQRAAEANREVVTTLTAAKAAQQDYFDTEKRIITQTETAAKGRSIYGLTIQASLNAQDAATKKNIVSNAAYNASLIGMTGAFRLMNAEIAKSGLVLNFFQLGLLKAKAGVAMLIGVLGTLSAVVNGALGALGLVAAVVGVLDSVFSKGSKELDNFNSVLTKVDDAAANAARTLAHLDKKGGYASATIDGISAMANAFVELASSAKEAVDSATLALAKMSTWDRIKDNIFGFFGGGVANNLAKALTKDVTSALDLLTKAGLDKEAREKFKAILGVDSLDTESVNKAILKLSDSAKNNLVTALSEANVALNNSQSRLQSFKAATEGTTKAYQDFIVSTANTNPIFRVGSNLENLGKTMETLATGSIQEMEAAMISLAESPQQGLLFGGDFSSQLVALRKGFLDQKAAVTAYENQLKELDKQIEVTSARMDELREGTQARTLAGMELSQLKKDRDFLSKEINLLPREKIAEARDLFNKGMDNAFKEGSRLISVGLGQAAEKAALTIAKANLGGLTGEQLAREQLALNKRDIEIQIRAIDTSIGLILSQERLRVSIEESNAAANLAQAKSDKRPQEVIERLEAALLASRGMSALLGQSGTPNLTGSDSNLAARAGVEGNADALRILKNQVLTLRAQLGAQLASRTEQAGAMEAADITGQRAIRQGQLQDLERTQNLQQAIQKEELTRLGIVNSIAGVSSRDFTLQQNVLETAQLINRQKQEQQTADLAIEIANEGVAKQKQIEYKRLITLRQQDELRNQRLQERQKLLQADLDFIGRRAEAERSAAELQNILAQTRLDVSGQELALYSSAYDMSKQVVITQQTNLDIQKAQLETSAAVAQAEAALQVKRQEAQARKNALTAEDIAQEAAINLELERQTTLTENTIAGLRAQGDAKTNILQKTREINLEQERYNLLLENSGRLAESLGTIFGDVGSKLGSLTELLTKIAISTEQGSKALEKIGKDADAAWSSGNIDQAIQLEKDYEVQKKKNVRTELDGNIKAISSTKNVFKEKTFAYKALEKVEKVMHIFRMTSMIKEVAMDIWKTGKSVANSAIRIGKAVIEAGVDGVKAVVKAISSMPFPLNIAAGAATAAVVSGLLSQIGGKGPNSGGGGGSFAPSAEQRQETQGTAMGYNSSGAKIQVRRGIFGDTDAKSESIANSLVILKENSVDGLSYNNRMVDLLASIDRGINNTAKGLYGIQGLRSGSMFGTVTGSQTGGGFLGTGLFGSKTSRSITDSGLIIEGTFAQLASDTNKAVIDFFEQVTVSKRSWYGKTRTWVETQRTEIDDATSEFFQDIFSNATELFIEVGAKAGVDASAINQILGGMDVGKNFTSLRGLKGEDFERELSAVIGTVLDDAASAIFKSFEGFAKFGEGMLETVVRVVDTNTKINQQIKNIGIDSTGLSFAITETLAELAGGLDKFLDQSNFFRENFLTEAERLAPIQKAVTAEMARLGYSTVDTREEFKQLVQSLDLTTDAGRQNYQALMNVADGFIKVTAEAAKQAEEASKLAQQEADERKNLEQKLFELTATREQLRERELEGLFAGNRELQREIWLREDQVNAAKALQANLKAVTNTIKSQVLALKDYKTSLLSGANSTLTATQQYRLAKSEVEGLVATISKTATTPEEIEARNIALGKLSSVSDKFLNQSRSLFASGAQYTTDFNTIMSIINSVSGSLENQLTDAEKQLGALETSNSYLQSIDSASKTTAQLLQAYLNLGGTPITTPGFAVGTNFVPQDMVAQIHRGERIIPAADNLELMSSIGNRNRTNEVLVLEIKKLNQKIQSLEQTVAQGATMNAQATDRNTAEIAQAVVDSSGKAIQANRLQAKAGIR